jgi:hypothetical protein
MLNKIICRMFAIWILSGLMLCFSDFTFAQKTKQNPLPALQKIPNQKQYNIIYILLDDQRYDAMGFLKRRIWTRSPATAFICRTLM